MRGAVGEWWMRSSLQYLRFAALDAHVHELVRRDVAFLDWYGAVLGMVRSGVASLVCIRFTLYRDRFMQPRQ